MHAAHQQIDAAEEFEHVGLKHIAADAEIVQRLGRKQPLIAEIVDGEQHANAKKRWVAAKRVAQINGRERGLPIVTVQYVGQKQITRDIQRGAAKHAKANMVVWIIRRVLAV